MIAAEEKKFWRVMYEKKWRGKDRFVAVSKGGIPYLTFHLYEADGFEDREDATALLGRLPMGIALKAQVVFR